MATREDDATTFTLQPELKLSTMDWSVEDVHKEFRVFKVC